MDFHEVALVSSSFNLLATIFSCPRFITQTVMDILLSCPPTTSMEGLALRNFSCNSVADIFTTFLSQEIDKVGVIFPNGGTETLVLTPFIGLTLFSICSIHFSHCFHSLSWS